MGTPIARRGFEELLGDNEPLNVPVATDADEPGFWLYSSGSTGHPKGTVHTHANLYWTAELYGKSVLGLTENDVCFSAAKLFFAYGLGNALTFPLSVGASVVLIARRSARGGVQAVGSLTSRPSSMAPLQATPPCWLPRRGFPRALRSRYASARPLVKRCRPRNR